MERSQRIMIFLTFFICTLCLTLLTTSLATHQWVVSRPIRSLTTNNNGSGGGSRLNVSLLFGVEPDDRKFRGEIHFGLFQGTKTLNYGLGDRATLIWVKQEMLRNSSWVPFCHWVLTIICVSIGMIFGLCGAIFAITNTVTTPIELLTGRAGLFLWNALAGFFVALALCTWSLHYCQTYRHSVMSKEEQQDGWTSSGRTHLGYSFYLVMITFALHMLNIAVIWRAGWPANGKREHRAGMDKQPEGLIMLY